MDQTEYEWLIDEKQRVGKFLDAINKEVEQAQATIRAASEWEARVRKKLADIEKRLAEIRGI